MKSASGDAVEASPQWSLRLFGGFELRTLPDGERVTISGKRDRVLLAYLILSQNYRQPRRKLTAMLWGEDSDETSLDNLRVCIWSLRKALGDLKHRVIASEGDDIVIDNSAFDADVEAFRRGANQPEATGLEAALNLYTGEFLDGLGIESEAFESWRRMEARRFRDEAVDTSLKLMTLFGESGHIERAIEVGQGALRLQPLHEPIIRRLMRLETENGRRAAAIQLYRTLDADLRAELDAQPEAETRALFAEIAGRGKERIDDPSTDANPASFELSGELSGTWARMPAIGSRRQSKMRRSTLLVAGALAAVTAVTLFSQFVPLTGTATEPVRADAVDTIGQVAIAVLPFTNLSSDPEQEFFSDGVTEEITSALARVADLRVIARTSAFEFKGQNRNVQAIAQQLNATHVIEGSVRKAGDQVRITAQLIQADTGLQVWTATYDRQLVNIFAIQEEIAQAIAGALRVPLGLASGESLVSNRTIEPEAYQQFLRARGLALGFESLSESIKLLEPIVAQYPDFAPAWGQLAMAYQRFPFFYPDMDYATRDVKRRVAEEWLTKAEAAAKRAIELDPNLPVGYSSLALTMTARGRYLQGDALFSKALALDPFLPEALHSYANMLGAVGRTEDALATRRRLLALDPFVLVYQSGIPDLLWISGQTDAVISNLSVTRSPADLAYLAKIYSAQGREREAVEAIKAIPHGNYPEGMVETAARLLSSPPPDTSSLESNPRLGRRLNFAYIQAGAPERALERFEDDVAAAYSPPNLMLDLWTPIYASVRKTERFRKFAHDAGLVDYWRSKGWPEFCRPTTGDDFVCN